MTQPPKEKAKEIFDKMYFVEDTMRNYPMCFDTAKQCALIAVDELIEEARDYSDIIFGNERIKYWSNVKTEIQNI